MSKASASTTLTIVPELGTFNHYLLCNKGDLWQNFQGSPSAPTAVVPDFSVTQPILSLYVTSSRVSGQEIPDKVEFYLGSVLVGTITKSGASYTKTNNSDTAYTGMFDLLDPTENSGCCGLKIKKNLVTVTNGESGQFRAVFVISEGTSSATLQATCPFNISEVVENSSITVIEAGDNYNFQITKNNTSVKLVAKHYKGLTEVTSGLTYKWYKESYGKNPGTDLANWELLVGKTSATLDVTEADVETAQRYMVRVFDASGVTVLGQDTQMVYDASDLYEIVIARNPEDGQAHKAGDKVSLTCKVYRRDKSVEESLPANTQWQFIGNTPAGTPIFSASSTSNTYEVTYNDIYSAGGQLEVSVIVEF